VKPLVLILVAVLAGSLIPLQSAMNSRIGQALHHPLYATLVSFGLAFILALVAWLVVNPAPPIGSNWHLRRGIPTPAGCWG
jgi:transporter family-2 protein